MSHFKIHEAFKFLLKPNTFAFDYKHSAITIRIHTNSYGNLATAQAHT